MSAPGSGRSLRIALAAVLALLVPETSAPAATLSVTDCGDSGQAGQLRTTIDTALPGDTIQVPGCVIVLTGPPADDANAGGDLDIAGTLTLRGLGPTATVLDGGGLDRVLHVLPGATVTVEDLALRNGRPPIDQAGGGILNEGTLTLTRVTVAGNTAEGGSHGGGIASTLPASLTATDVEVSGNEAHIGGGIYSLGALALVRARLVSNQANNRGGGLVVDGSPAPVTIADTTIAANSGGGGGAGGGRFGGGAVALVSRSTISGNWMTAGGSGGGLRVDGAGTTLTLANSTVAHNTATSDGGGGGLDVTDAAVTIVNSTIARNADVGNFASGAGGIRKTTGILVLRNSIVAMNDVGPDTLHADVDPADLDESTSNLVGGDPRLGPLQDNGGPTLTMLPLSGSPAIDAGSNAAAASLGSDQRGLARVQAGDDVGPPVVDIGAVEVEPAPGGLLAISPPSGSYLVTGRPAVVLFLRAPGRSIDPAASQAVLDDVDVTPTLIPCLPPGIVPDGGLALRCPTLAGGAGAARAGLPAGGHALAVTLAFTDGSVARAAVRWDLLATTE